MICYHGTPISGTDVTAAKVLAGRDAMVSFWAPTQLSICAEVCRTFAIDCGAFSAWRSGAPIENWEKYYAFVNDWQNHPSFAWAIIPDVIDGTEAENDALLAAWPHKYGVPVWHLHERIERLNRLIETHERVALGSSGAYAKVGSPQWWGRMAVVMKAATSNGVPRTKLHGLRMLDPTVLAHLPLASADSTNVARNIAIDTKWTGPYVPVSPAVKAAVIMDRIESHAKAARWCGTAGQQRAFELLDCAL